MWYTKMCVLDSNCRCLNVEIMHSAITCLRWRALMWNLKTALLKESMIREYHVFKEIRALQGFEALVVLTLWIQAPAVLFVTSMQSI